MTTSMQEHRRLSPDDFFTGLFAALAEKGGTTFSLRTARFDEAVVCAYDLFERQASAEGYRIRFRVALHPLHGESGVVREGITRAAQRDLVSLDNPEFQDLRLKLGPSTAPAYLESLGSPDLYRNAARVFLEKYN